MKKTKIGVLFSAGIDSTCQIDLLLSRGYDVYPITFDDDSSMTKLKREFALEFWLSYWELHEKHINIRYMRREELRDKNGYVPGWKLTMITNALAYCEARNLEELHLGYLKDDRYPYPDEDPANMQKVVDLYNNIYGSSIKLVLSISEFTKAELIQGAYYSKLPLDKTFSCRQVVVAGLAHCGKCDICRLRHDAFIKAGVEDPTYYVYQPKLIPQGEKLEKKHVRK